MSLQVIKINSIDENLTADNNIITVDNNNTTIDVTLTPSEEYTIKVSYRFWSNDVKLHLWNELKELETIIDLVPDSEPGIMVLKFQHNFVDGDSYEAKVLDTQGQLIWRGKILATIQTDLQNYKLHKVVSNNVYKI